MSATCGCIGSVGPCVDPLDTIIYEEVTDYTNHPGYLNPGSGDATLIIELREERNPEGPRVPGTFCDSFWENGPDDDRSAAPKPIGTVHERDACLLLFTNPQEAAACLNPPPE